MRRIVDFVVIVVVAVMLGFLLSACAMIGSQGPNRTGANSAANLSQNLTLPGLSAEAATALAKAQVPLMMMSVEQYAAGCDPNQGKTIAPEMSPLRNMEGNNATIPVQ